MISNVIYKGDLPPLNAPHITQTLYNSIWINVQVVSTFSRCAGGSEDVFCCATYSHRSCSTLYITRQFMHLYNLSARVLFMCSLLIKMLRFLWKTYLIIFTVTMNYEFREDSPIMPMPVSKWWLFICLGGCGKYLRCSIVFEFTLFAQFYVFCSPQKIIYFVAKLSSGRVKLWTTRCLYAGYT